MFTRTTSAADSAASSTPTAGRWPPRTFRRRPAAHRCLFSWTARPSWKSQATGHRPSPTIKVAADKTGLITAWESESWASGGISGGGSPPIPYVFTEIPNQRLKHSAVSLNVGPQRAWRAPNHPQASYLTCAAIDDLAAKLKMDPTEVFDKNFKHTAREETYRGQLVKAMEMSEWKKRWHAARRFGLGPRQARHGHGCGHLGRGGSRQPVPHHHQPGRLGDRRTRLAGSGHRHAHHHQPGGGRKPGTAAPGRQRENRRQLLSGFRFERRLHYRGRRLQLHPEIDAERARQAV